MVLMVSCAEKVDTFDDSNVLPRPMLINILIDLEIMEAYYEQTHKRPQIYKTTLDSSSRAVLENYGVTEEQLRYTLDHYSQSPDSLYALYEEALDSINSMVIQNKNKE